jgi:hypothetical protein
LPSNRWIGNKLKGRVSLSWDQIPKGGGKLRPTTEQTYWSRDFETVEAQKACTKQGAGIATRVIKSGAGVRANQGKAEDRKLSEIEQS